MNQGEFKGENTRQFYRINYPDVVRPRLRTEQGIFLVQSLSEYGGHFITDSPLFVTPDETIFGSITFHDGSTSFIEGQVIRSFGNGFILCFSIGIPLKVIVKEQRFLMEQYRHANHG